MFIFSADPMTAGKIDFISAELVEMSELKGVKVPAGMKLFSHSPRRGMLTEFILHHPRPDNIVVAKRMDCSLTARCVLTYFCHEFLMSKASAIFVSGALQVQLDNYKRLKSG